MKIEKKKSYLIEKSKNKKDKHCGIDMQIIMYFIINCKLMKPKKKKKKQ